MKNKTDYADDLKAGGLKKTRHRTAILDILDQSDQPVNAEQVYLKLKEENVSINLSTVYRILDALAVKNIVTKLSLSGDNKAFFEFNRKVHRHYLVCIECKKILAINDCPLEDYEKTLEKETNFSISGHKLDIYGYCPECKKKRY